MNVFSFDHVAAVLGAVVVTRVEGCAEGSCYRWKKR